jgi:hypothetical protein
MNCAGSGRRFDADICRISGGMPKGIRGANCANHSYRNAIGKGGQSHFRSCDVPMGPR